MHLHFAFFVPLFALVHFSLCAKNPDLWNQFRGPNGSGIRKDAKVGIHSMVNMLWKIPLPFGLSCPVLSEDKIFLTGFEKDRLVTLAFDRKSGKILWKKKAPETELEKFHESSSPATPTPFVDQDRLFVYFGSFGLLCYDHKGKRFGKNAFPAPRASMELLPLPSLTKICSFW